MAHADPAAHTDHDHAGMLRRWIWRDFANIVLGVWLASSPLTFGLGGSVQAWNDVACGVAIVAFGLLTLFPRFDLARWALCGIGIWLLFAPLVFWVRDPAVYANDTLIGTLVIAFSVLIPMMPGRTHHRVMMAQGPDRPPGWSHNPSDWIQRAPIIAMALVGFFLSRYLAAYQLGHVPYPWDPFFGDGTRRVLESEVSKAWPIPDAGLGAVSYMLEALSGFMGVTNRWRAMPWMVLMFGVLVVPLGIVSIVLVILQPVAVGAWCALCLVTAVAMLFMISPAVDEVVATGQFLIGARREGKPMWRTFWVGGTLDAYADEGRSGHPTPEERKPVAARIAAAMELDAVPWNLAACAALGVWLMAAPAVLGASGVAASVDQVAGALVVTWAVIGFGQIIRPIRLLNLVTGVVIVAAPWMIEGATTASRTNDVAVGVLVMALSLPRGRIQEQFATWNRVLRW